MLGEWIIVEAWRDNYQLSQAIHIFLMYGCMYVHAKGDRVNDYVRHLYCYICSAQSRIVLDKIRILTLSGEVGIPTWHG